ncbi:hypothetical protein AAULH_06991 [Lactobacillus helveticus MTCC 5463]|nr:hypothetical protein AAULH_06991 [Lactobacillus helveticus MTCC 5463]
MKLKAIGFEGVCSNHPAEHSVHYLASKLHEIYEKDQAGTLTEADIPKCDECGAPLALNMAGEDFQINQKQDQRLSRFYSKI